MNAIELLKEQHRKVERLLGEIENANESEVVDLVIELSDSLAGHMVIEERLFYPAVRQADHDLVMESFEEHAVARFALKRLQGLLPSDDRFKARLTTLKELIAHHVKEEEGDLFPKAERAISAEMMAELTEDMRELFEETVSTGFDDTYRFRTPSSKARSARLRPNGGGTIAHR